MSDHDIEAPPPGEDTPLIVNAARDEEQPQQELEPAQLKPIKEGSIKETLVGIFAAITVLASALAMIINHGIFVVISGLFGVFLSPFAAFQQTKITQTIAMKETNEFFQKQLDILHESNEKLEGQVKEMTQSVDHLKDMEKTLGTVQTMRGNCLQQLEEQLRKQREIASMTVTNVKNDIIGNLLEVAINTDDGDMVLSDEEMEHVIKNIESINGVDILEDKVRKLMMEHGRNMMSLMEVAKKTLREDVPEEEKLFVYVNS